MRYVKTFESFDSDELLDYIRDILIDLKDIGISYEISVYDNSLLIRFTRETNTYNWPEVKTYIGHLISYLSDFGFKLNQEESSKDLLSSRENRRFNYLEVRFDKDEEKKRGLKSFFQRNRKKYSTLDLRNGKIYVKFSGNDEEKMRKILNDAFPGCYYTSSNRLRKGIYFAKDKFYWGYSSDVSLFGKIPVITEDDIQLSKTRVDE